MVNFFIKHKKVRGVITVFLTLIYLSTYLLIGMFVDGGRVRMAQTTIEDVQQIATENVMSQYNRGLYEYYGLFGVTDYTCDNIVKDVQDQIKQSVGLEVSDDTIKAFLQDVWTGTNSAINNLDTLKGDTGIIDKGKQYTKEIGKDIEDSHKRFDPYGIKMVSATASYIDLTNVDAIRAQIRDEMRYTAPLVVGANFFDAVNQFMSVGGAAKSLKEATDIVIDSSSKVDEKVTEYYDSLDTFADSFHEFVVTSYKPTTKAAWGFIEVDEEFKDSVEKFTINLIGQIGENKDKFVAAINPIFAIKQAGEVVASFFSGFISSFRGSGGSQDNSEKLVEAVKTGLLYATKKKENKIEEFAEEQNKRRIATDMAGFGDLITNNFNNLLDIYKNFTDENFEDGDWPDGSDYKKTVRVKDGEIEEIYDEKKHRAAVKSYTNQRNYADKIEEIITVGNTAKVKINESISKVNICMDDIGKIELKFKSKCDAAPSKESKEVFINCMETYIRTWDRLAFQKNMLQRFSDKLDKQVKLLEAAKEDINNVCNAIKNEPLDEDWDEPEHKYDLKKTELQDFHNSMLSLAVEEAGINIITSFQENANEDNFSADIFTLIGAVMTKQKSDKEELEENAGKLEEMKKNKDTSGPKRIEKHEKSYNLVFNPYTDIKIVEDPETDDITIDGFNQFNVVKKINEIMKKAQEIAESMAIGLRDNIYDETYILSHFRDYVHTHRFRENEYSIDTPADITNNKKNHIDTVLNPKFVKDQSATNYLDNAQFYNMEVDPAEIEYIIWGNESSKVNIALMYTNIFIIRLALNYVAVFTSPNALSQVKDLATASGPFFPIVFFAAPLIYALPKAVFDTKAIMFEGKEVKLWNGSSKLKLYSAFSDEVDNAVVELKNYANSIKQKLPEVLGQMKDNLSTETVIQNVYLYKDESSYQNVEKAASYLNSILGIELLENFKPGENIFNDNDDLDKDKGPRAGYSDYLLIYLFFRGIAKKSQINNLQDVIETNMRKVQPDFRLKNTYSQIGVETECLIKYLFMTQVFMGQSFASTKGKFSVKGFPIKIKTSFAY